MACRCRSMVSSSSRFHSSEKRCDAALCKLPEQLDAGVIQPQLDHRQIRMRRLQIFLQRGAIQLQLGRVQLVERIAEMHQHQIALVAQQRVHRALPGCFLASRRRRRSFLRDLLLARRARACATPASGSETSDAARSALQGERHRGQLGRRSLHFGLGGHRSRTPGSG